MDKYKFIKKGIFESLEKFERKINDQSRKGWRAISMAKDPNGQMIILFERLEH